MTSRARIEESEPISPELVLVSSPELAREAREQLPSPAPAAVKPEPERAEPVEAAPEQAPSVREQLSAPAPAVAKSKPDEQSTPLREGSDAPRPEPPPYPRPDIVEAPPEPEPSRLKRGKVLPVVALVALAGAGGGAAYAWSHFSSSKDTSAGRLPSKARITTTASSPGAAAPKSAPAPPPKSAPAPPPKSAPAPPVIFVPGRGWAWSPSKGARAYLVRFFLNGRQVLKKRTAKNQLVLPRGFRYVAGGGYRWIVRPISGAPSRPKYGQPIVDSKFVLTPAAARQSNRP